MASIWSFPGEENRRSNPYTATLVCELRRLGHHVSSPGWPRRLLGKCDIVHLHWPQKVVQSSLAASLRSIAMWLLFLRVQRVRGARIVWTVHNVESHEGTRPGLERWWMTRLLALVDGLHVLSEESLRGAIAAYPAMAAKQVLVAPHWIYGDAYPPVSPGAGSGQSAIAFLGDLKAYKGLEEFVVALERGEPAGDRRYIIHGKPMDDIDPQALTDRLMRLRQRGWSLDFVLERLTDQQMSDRLAETGLLVLPYRSGENSGLAVLAAERGTPLLVAPLPAFEPLLDELGSPRVTAITAPLTPGQMERACQSARAVAGTIDGPFVAGRSPAAIVRKISNYYLFLLDRQPG